MKTKLLVILGCLFSVSGFVKADDRPGPEGASPSRTSMIRFQTYKLYENFSKPNDSQSECQEYVKMEIDYFEHTATLENKVEEICVDPHYLVPERRVYQLGEWKISKKNKDGEYSSEKQIEGDSKFLTLRITYLQHESLPKPKARDIDVVEKIELESSRGRDRTKRTAYHGYRVFGGEVPEGPRNPIDLLPNPSVLNCKKQGGKSLFLEDTNEVMRQFCDLGFGSDYALIDQASLYKVSVKKQTTQATDVYLNHPQFLSANILDVQAWYCEKTGGKVEVLSDFLVHPSLPATHQYRVCTFADKSSIGVEPLFGGPQQKAYSSLTAALKPKHSRGRERD